jgi:alpha-L-fucosidase 2
MRILSEWAGQFAEVRDGARQYATVNHHMIRLTWSVVEGPVVEGDAAAVMLRYDDPAPGWLSALPLGNGRLGAMCWGGPDGERIGINHDLAWSGPLGGPTTATVPDAPQRIARARALLLAGRPRPAEDLLRSVAVPHSQAYLPVADLFVRCVPSGGNDDGEPDHYSRGLDLVSAHAWVARRWGGRAVRQETLVSHPAGVLLHTIRGARFDAEIRLAASLRVNEVRTSGRAGGGQLTYRVELPVDVAPGGKDDESQDDGSWDGGPIRWAPAGSPWAREVLLCLVLRTDGEVEFGPDRLSVHGGSWSDLVLTAEVTGVPEEADDDRPGAGGRVPDRPQRAEAAAGRAQARARQAIDRGRAALVAEHRAEVEGRLGGFTLDLRGAPPDRPTDRVVAEPERAPAADRGLIELLVAYARYLLVAGSRPGTQPLTLQGLWNAERQPPWSSNYTLNINLQMAYWAAETWGLADCHRPLLDLIERLSVTGTRAAREVYGRRGWTVHHNTDLWAEARPVGGGWVDPAWSSWPLGGAWLAQHLIEHVQHAADPVTAAVAARPVLAGAVRFCLDWLVELPDGSLGTAPSTSPENTWIGPDGRAVSIGVSSTCDLALIVGLFRGYLGVLDLTGVDPAGAPAPAHDPDPTVAEIAAALGRIAPPGIGRQGELLEWSQEVVEAEPGHRHTSHLVGLYPLHLIDLDRTPELARAAAVSLDRRGDESTGWALAWRICLWARLRRPDRVAHLLAQAVRPAGPPQAQAAQRGGLYPNLFSAHPPFQLDGNLGLAAGVLEALVQSGPDWVRLLPALPSTWPEGRVTGVHTRAGLVVDLSWSAGRVSELVLRALRPTRFTVRLPAADGPADEDDEGGEMGPFRLAAGEQLRPLGPADRPRPGPQLDG